MSLQVDMGPCLGYNINVMVAKYTPTKIFVIPNAPWYVEDVSIQLVQEQRLYAFWLRS